MALVVITLQDASDGTLQATVNAHPPLPTNVLEGRPTQAQSAAALMLDALQEAVGTGDAPRIALLNQ